MMKNTSFMFSNRFLLVILICNFNTYGVFSFPHCKNQKQVNPLNFEKTNHCTVILVAVPNTACVFLKVKYFIFVVSDLSATLLMGVLRRV